MAKRTAIIDIGSNSARLVIFEKTSRYGFHLICEQKSKVRIGEGAYEKEGYLQPSGIKRAFLTLQSFHETILKHKVNKTICVATSALRDAPNSKAFVSWIKKELGIHIKVIDGQKEARYGAIAVCNLLPVTHGISIDIGGGSSDLALIHNGDIIDTYSLNLGTVRLKELFFDKHSPVSEAKSYIAQALETLPEHFKHTLGIGIGGTLRTLSKGIMKSVNYPLDKLHAYSYSIEEHHTYLNNIPYSSAKNLKHFHLKQNRFDTIREGVLIFNELVRYMGIKDIITSSVGVREGVYLSQVLKTDALKFPDTINPSIESLLSRFKPIVNIEKKKKAKLKIGIDLYNTFIHEIASDKDYQDELIAALKLSSIGKTLTIYKSHKHAFYIAMQELNYGFTHKQMLLISLLLRMNENGLLKKSLYHEFKELLPSKKTVEWLSFIFRLIVLVHETSNAAKIEFSYSNKMLIIYSDKSLYLAKEKIRALKKPTAFAIIIVDVEELPKDKALGID